MADDGVTTSNVISGLIGGAAGSVLTLLGSWGLAKRSEGRARQARLHAIEGELRGNRLTIEQALERKTAFTRVYRDVWDKIRIDLAVDSSPQTYQALQTFYWLFDDAAARLGGVEEGSANNQEEKNIRFWLNQCSAAQTVVTGELHITWRVRSTLTVWARTAATSLKRRLPWVKETEGETSDD